MHNPFRAGPRPVTTTPRRGPALDVSVGGIDPRVETRPAMPTLHLAAARETSGACPDSVAALLAEPERWVLRRMTLDVRSFRDVLEARGGWNVLAQLARDPADAAVNAVFRAAVETPADGRPHAPAGIGDVDCDVRIVRAGDAVAGRCRVDLGRARLALTPLLTESARLTRRLAEALARPRDRAARHDLEEALGRRLLGTPWETLVSPHADAPQCAVPGAWAAVPRPAVAEPAERPAPRTVAGVATAAR